MRAQAFKMGQQAVSGRSPLGPQDVYNLPGQQREQGYYYDQPNIPGQPGAVRPVTQQQHWAKRLGMGALRGLDVMAAGGGGTLRRLGQALTPGEQILERELGRITQERGATMNPWEKFKRYGEASRLDPGKEWTTPFGWAEHKGFRYLPEKIGTRGIAEVVGDPINLAALVPFVGAPIRAAEMGLLGLAKGAIAGSAGSVGRGLAVGGGKRTLGEAAKGIARAPGRGLARAGEEAVKGVKGSIDIERKIGRGIFTPTRAAPKGDKAKILEEIAEEIAEETQVELPYTRKLSDHQQAVIDARRELGYEPRHEGQKIPARSPTEIAEEATKARHADQELMKARVPSKLADDTTDASLGVKDIAYKSTVPILT